MDIRNLTLPDSGITLTREHRYFDENGKEFYGITGTLLPFSLGEAYEGVSEATLARAAEVGSSIHQDIELYDRFGGEPANDFVRSYAAIKAEHFMTTIANEYIVTDKVNFASPIDIVWADEAGAIYLVDTKTTSNYDQDRVSLQLSWYKVYFERQTGLKVAGLFCLHIDKKTALAELIRVPEVLRSKILKATNNYIKGKPNCYVAAPGWYTRQERKIELLMKQKARIEEELADIKEDITAQMVAENYKYIHSKRLNVSYTPATFRTSFDSKRFEAEHPELYAQYIKRSEVKATTKMTLAK